MSLTIELQPSEAAAQQQLQQRLATAMRARDLDVCPHDLGEQRLARVHVSAPLPELSPTRVEIQAASGAAVHREIDIASLPLETRPSAIASATDELLGSVLQSSAVAGATVRTETPATAETPARAETAAGAVSDAAETTSAAASAEQLPWLELGLGGGGALFERDGKAYRGELLARWRPLAQWRSLSRLSTPLRVGGDRLLPEDTGWFASTTGGEIVESASGWHTGLDVGWELFEPAPWLGLRATAGLALARAHHMEDWPSETPGTGPLRMAASSTWELGANLGGEVAFRGDGWGAELALSMLLPLTPRERNWGREPVANVQTAEWDYAALVSSSDIIVPPGNGFGEQLGGQLDLRLWIALGS